MVMESIFEFVGVGQYRYVAGVNQQFRRSYSTFLIDARQTQMTRRCRPPRTEGHPIPRLLNTTLASITESRSRVELFWMEYKMGWKP